MLKVLSISKGMIFYVSHIVNFNLIAIFAVNCQFVFFVGVPITNGAANIKMV